MKPSEIKKQIERIIKVKVDKSTPEELESAKSFIEGYEQGKNQALAEVEKLVDEWFISERIISEFRKHSKLDWHRIAEIKIKSELKQKLKELEK